MKLIFYLEKRDFFKLPVAKKVISEKKMSQVVLKIVSV